MLQSKCPQRPQKVEFKYRQILYTSRSDYTSLTDNYPTHRPTTHQLNPMTDDFNNEIHTKVNIIYFDPNFQLFLTHTFSIKKHSFCLSNKKENKL